MKIVALSVGFPGVIRVLQEGAKLGWWEFLELTPDVRAIPPADAYFFGAWHSVYEVVLRALPKQAKVGVLWTSSMGEMGLEPSEFPIFNRLLGDRRISFIWSGSRVLASFPKVFYAPYPFIPHGYETSQKTDSIVFFAPATQKKNALNTLLAMCLLQDSLPELTMHNNVQVFSLYPNRPNKYHFWLARDQMLTYLREARLAFVCSWAETFSYHAAEAILSGTPVVGTRTIPFLPTNLTVDNPNDPLDIAATAERIYAAPEAALAAQREALLAFVERGNALAYQQLQTTLSV